MMPSDTASFIKFLFAFFKMLPDKVHINNVVLLGWSTQKANRIRKAIMRQKSPIASDKANPKIA